MSEATKTAAQKLREHLAPIADLYAAMSLLDWDQQVCMPPGGGDARAEQSATLQRIAHEMFTGGETRRLLEAAEAERDRLDPDSDDAALIVRTRRDYDQATRLPADFVAEKARASTLSTEVWRKARPANDFAMFRPHLAKMFELARREADYLGYEDHPYDALLDQYEPLVTSKDVGVLFDELREATVPLVRAIAERGQVVDAEFITREYPEAAQEAFGREVAVALGYDFGRGRLDRAPHPFASGSSRDDVRITTRYDVRYLPTAIFGIFHEVGHAMYEQGVDPALARSPLGFGTSLGVHESQSRMWENQVARSRTFWRQYFPRLREYFPDQLANADAEKFYRAVNQVKPSLIRVEADEVTYNLHIILRFELEKGLLDGALQVDELPEVWNAKMAEYLGLVPPTDADGVLQDIHWSGGGIGYFPTYTLGNVISAQLFEAAERALPDLSEQIGRGQFSGLLGWLREHVHRHGRKYFTQDLLQRTTGRGVTAEPYLAYLRRKYGDIYGIAVPDAATTFRS